MKRIKLFVSFEKKALSFSFLKKWKIQSSQRYSAKKQRDMILIFKKKIDIIESRDFRAEISEKTVFKGGNNMRNKRLSLIAWFLALCMLFGAFAS